MHRLLSKSTLFCRISWVLRFLLVFVAWQGPIPYVHCHGTLANSSDQHSSWLTEHLHHHASVGTDASVNFGWHLHTSVPGSESDDSHEPKHKQDLPFLKFGATDALTDTVSRCSGSSDWAFNLAQPRCSELVVVKTLDRLHTHFFDSFAPTLPLPLRFSILRS